MTAPLVFVRSVDVYTSDDDFRSPRRHVEPLVIDAIGHTWTATGERNALGRLLYTLTPERIGDLVTILTHAQSDGRS